MLPFLYWEGTIDVAALPRYIVIAFIPGLLLLGLLIQNFRTAQNFILEPVTIVMGTFLLWGTFSLYWGIDPKAAVSEILQMASLLLLLLLTIELHKTRALFGITLFVLLTGATLIAIIGLLQSFGFNPFGYKQSHVPAATFLNKNIASQYLDLVIPLYLYFLLFAKTNALRWLTAVAFALALSYDVTIYSRGSWLGLLASTAVLLIIVTIRTDLRNLFLGKARQNAGKILAIIALVIVINSLPQKIPDYSLERTNVVQTDVSMRIRLHANINALHMIMDRPLTGVGLGGFMLGFREYLFTPLDIPTITETKYMVNLHNDPLQIVTELGVIGGMLLLLFLSLLYLAAKQVLRKSELADKTRFVILLSALVASGIHSLVSFPLHRPTSAALFFVILGMLLALYHRSIDAAKFKLPARRLRFLAAAGIISLLCGNFIYHYYYVQNSLSMRFADHYARVAFTANDTEAKRLNCQRSMHYVRQTDYTSSISSRILIPFIYSICETRIDKMYDFMNYVLTYDSNQSIALLTRGTIHLESNYLNDAARDFSRAIELLPNRAGGYLGLARLAERLGKKQDAVLLYEKAQELAPDNLEIKAALDRIAP